jgi:hypothetical protein
MSGFSPCGVDQMCIEDLDLCSDKTTVNASCRPGTLLRPLVRTKRCTWLVVQWDKDNRFNPKSNITFHGKDKNFQGIEVNEAKIALMFFNYVFMPVCIEKDASVGRWTMNIETIAVNAEDLSMNRIEANFLVK